MLKLDLILYSDFDKWLIFVLDVDAARNLRKIFIVQLNILH